MPRVAEVVTASEVAMAALRAQGADQRDPVRFRFIEALARRTEVQQGEARRVLEKRLAVVLQEFSDAAARPEASRRQLSAGRAASPLAALAQLARRAPAPGEPAGSLRQDHAPTSTPMPAPAAELKSLHYFRDSWAKLGMEQQLAEALAQAPENAGPLNSHLLVLRALERMHDLSPDYLNRFMSYADGLFFLAQVDMA